MAHGDAREGKWRKWRMEWVASTLHTSSEHGVSSITTADAHTLVASSRLNWRPIDLNGLVCFAERWNLFSARVPSHFKCSLLTFNMLQQRHKLTLNTVSHIVSWDHVLDHHTRRFFSRKSHQFVPAFSATPKRFLAESTIQCKLLVTYVRSSTTLHKLWRNYSDKR